MSEAPATVNAEERATQVLAAVREQAAWLERHGELSQDHQDYWNSKLGRAAKSLYYRGKWLGRAAVAPLVFLEAFAPGTRKWFWRPMRFPIADAHWAMGFAYLHQATGEREHYDRARHFLDVLIQTRCTGYRHYCWGYPFSWQTVRGAAQAETPLITTTPYVYEAFDAVHVVDGEECWPEIMRSVAQHALEDIFDTETTPTASACSYAPRDETREAERNVVNASAYRAALLIQAAQRFGEDAFAQAAERNVNYVLEAQEADGSWFYAPDKAGQFIDNFHTCFVLKALAKFERAVDHDGCRQAIERGAEYYLKNLLDERGMPKPFAKAPRTTVYKYELYDCAECLNLALLLRERRPEFERVIENLLDRLLADWRKRDGSFRTRKLLLGWNNVPMHRWGQSQLFRALCLYLREKD